MIVLILAEDILLLDDLVIINEIVVDVVEVEIRIALLHLLAHRARTLNVALLHDLFVELGGDVVELGLLLLLGLVGCGVEGLQVIQMGGVEGDEIVEVTDLLGQLIVHSKHRRGVT